MAWIALWWREDSVNSSRMLIKQTLGYGIVCDVRRFLSVKCMLIKIIKFQKLTLYSLFSVSLYFLSLELLTEKTVGKTFCGFVHHPGNHFKVSTAANKN